MALSVLFACVCFGVECVHDPVFFCIFCVFMVCAFLMCICRVLSFLFAV